MVRTRVGYSGGSSADPTYESIGDHSETVQVDFDPSVITYELLLEAFWSSHDAAEPPFSRQYRSAIFYADEEQRQAAAASKAQKESVTGKTMLTDIEPFSGFYLAEDYHQKTYLQTVPELMAEMTAIYPDPEDLLNSTAAARLNGYAGGYGDLETVQKNLDSLGLSEAGKQKLLEVTESGLIPGCPVPSPAGQAPAMSRQAE